MHDWWMEVIIYMLAGASFAVIYKVPHQYIPYSSGLALFVYLGRFGFTDVRDPYRVFFTAFTIAIVSNLLSRFTGRPSQLFLVPGVIMLVPGRYMFELFAAIMTKDLQMAVDAFLVTGSFACSITFALLLGRWLINPNTEL